MVGAEERGTCPNGSFCLYRGTDYVQQKETIQPNNNAPRRTLLFRSFDSFVMTVPEERPVRNQAEIIKLSPCRSHSQASLNLVISRRSCAKTAKKNLEKKSDVLAKLLFFFLNLLAQLFKRSYNPCLTKSHSKPISDCQRFHLHIIDRERFQ